MKKPTQKPRSITVTGIPSDLYDLMSRTMDLKNSKRPAMTKKFTLVDMALAAITEKYGK
jgi:hypothetical protein